MTDDVRIEMLDDHRGFVSAGGAVQSYVNLADPGDLRFGYTRHIRAVVDAMADGPVSAVHLGGAGLCVPRYIGHVRPGSAQVVFEPDRALTALVLAQLPLGCAGIEVDSLDGRAGLVASAPDSADLLVVDAFDNHRVPAELTTAEFFRIARGILRKGGYGVVNAIDHPDAAYVGRLCKAVVVGGAGPVSVVGPSHPHFGNYTVVFGAPIAARLLGDADPQYEVWTDERLTALLKVSDVLKDATSMPSPLPPEEALGDEWS